MSAPRHLIDALESVVSLFFSNVRHNHRAAFLLCDELVEVTCREKIKAAIPRVGRMQFKPTLEHPQVGFDVAVPGLGKSVHDCHVTRNDMQHNNPAATVDEHACADAILDAVRVLDHCFPGTTTALPDRLNVALRVVGLYGHDGDPGILNRFADEMRREHWRTIKRAVGIKEVAVTPGDRQYWHLVILSEFQQIEAILNRVNPP